MTAVAFHQSGFFLKSASNCPIVLLAQIDCMRSLTRALGRFFVLRPIFLARLSVWRGQSIKLGSLKIAAASGIISTMQAGLHFRSFFCHGLFNLTPGKHPHPAKLRSSSFSPWLSANGRVLMKVLSSFLSPIPLNGKKRRNRGAFRKKASSKAAFLILPLHNSSKDALLLLPLHPLIVSSSLRLPAAKSGVGVFGKDNAGRGRGDDLGSIGADGGTRANNPGIGTDVNTGADDPSTAADNSGTTTDNPGTTAEDSGTATDDPCTGKDADMGANDPGPAVDNPGTGTDADTRADDPGTRTNADIEANNPGTAASNKACARAASLFALRHALFLLASSSESMAASLPSSSPSSSSTTSRSKPVLSCSVTLVKRGAPSSRYLVDEMWRPSLSKVSSGMSAVVRFS